MDKSSPQQEDEYIRKNPDKSQIQQKILQNHRQIALDLMRYSCLDDVLDVDIYSTPKIVLYIGLHLYIEGPLLTNL